MRRVYKATGNFEKESKTIETMKMLINSNDKSRAFRKYFDFLDDEILAYLNDSFEMSQVGVSNDPSGSSVRPRVSPHL